MKPKSIFKVIDLEKKVKNWKILTCFRSLTQRTVFNQKNLKYGHTPIEVCWIRNWNWISDMLIARGQNFQIFFWSAPKRGKKSISPGLWLAHIFWYFWKIYIYTSIWVRWIRFKKFFWHKVHLMVKKQPWMDKKINKFCFKIFWWTVRTG